MTKFYPDFIPDLNFYPIFYTQAKFKFNKTGEFEIQFQIFKIESNSFLSLAMRFVAV